MIRTEAELHGLHLALCPPPRPARLRARVLLPAVLVLLLAALGPALDAGRRCPAGTDGPQFRCWLEQR